MTPKLLFLSLFAMMASSNVVTAVSDNRAVSGYVGVSTGGSFAVTIDISGKEGARVDAPDQRTLDLVETVVENNILQIRFKNTVNFINVGPVSVFVDAITVNSLQTEGSSSINVLRPTNQPHIDLASMGSGHITLALQSDSVTVNAQGSSVIDISGACQSAQITTQGSAQFNGAQLQINSAAVLVQGSGQVEVAVTASISGTVQGGGLLRIRGQPQEQVQTQGAGRVEHF